MNTKKIALLAGLALSTATLAGCGGDNEKEGKCGEGSCGEKKSMKAEGSCGEGSCGEKKAKEMSKKIEGKCGEGSCGSK